MKIPQRMTVLSSSVITVALFLSAVQPVSAALDTWVGNTDANWGTANNWSPAATPAAGDSLLFGTAGSSGATLNNNIAAGTAFDGISFSGSAFTLNGNGVLLSGGGSSNTIGVINNSGQVQTFSTLPLTLDHGYYTFSSPSGSIALNSSLTLNTGGVAYFDANNTSTSLTLDAGTGLITGLEGSGLIYDGNFTPTSLATISGGSIVAYPMGSYVNVASGAIPSGATNNLNLTASGATTAYSAVTGSTANTITVAQAGGGGGADFTSTLTLAGTLTLGANGGFYVLSGGSGTNHADFSLSNGSITAGTSGPGAINFVVNGANANNEVSVSSAILNNAGAGAVTVIKTGPGSMNLNTNSAGTSSTYSGGLYVNQGQLQFNAVTNNQLGSGPVYIGTNASLYYTASGTISNNMFLSPGPGANVYGSAAVSGGAGFIFAGSSTTLGVSGSTLTLQGAPVTNFPASISTPTGGSISGNVTSGTLFLNGQVTGTGTLELTAAHSFTAKFQNASGVNTNNWQGGMIIGGHSGVAANVLVQMGDPNQIPSGPGTGDIVFLPAANTGNANARFDLNGFNTTVNGLIGTSLNINSTTYEAGIYNQGASSCTLTFGANNDSAQFNGTVNDGGSSKALNLVKVGTGTQTFAGNFATNHGNITVSAGTLAFSGANAVPSNSPTITVAAGATLDGSGLSAGGLTVYSNQTLNCVGTVIGSTTVNGAIQSLDAIGTFTNNGNITLAGGGTFIWDINNATGSAGADPGWSQLDAIGGGGINITATSGSQFTIDVTSLNSADAPGLISNFNNAGNTGWAIMQSSVPITGFSPSAFFINTSGFSNSLGSGAFSVSLSRNHQVLLLTFVSTPVVSTALTDQTNSAGTTATFTVVANGATVPITYQWTQGTNALISGGTSASGGAVTITTNGHSSTLTIANVQDADDGGITVAVSDNVGDSGTSSASLTVIDPPTSPAIAQSVGDGIYAGGLVDLTATANGTQPFTYTWYRNGVLVTNNSSFSGATSGTLGIYLSGALGGNYTVVIANSAGSATNSFALGPVSTVPGQIIFEPFDSYVAENPASRSVDNINNITNLYNQITGSPAWWFHSSGSGIQMVATFNDLTINNNNQQGGTYPWPGLAGNSTNELYWTTSLNDHLEFGQIEGFPAGSKVYVSFILSQVSLGTGTDGEQDVIAGFSSSDSGTAFNLKICTQIIEDANTGNSIQLGIAKGAGVGSTQNVDSNTLWSATMPVQQDQLIVACYTVVSGGPNGTTNDDDTVAMWINPAPSTFYASEANVPTPLLGPTSFGVPNSVIRDFIIHSVNPPASHRIADLRIGTTWASVTPPSAPTLSLGNVYAPVASTATLTSQNAGNPVLNYGWQFNGGAALTDGPTGHGSTISGSGTYSLTISNVQAADYGTYTVNGTNTDISPLDSATNLTGSASGLLTGLPPKLSVVRSPPTNVIVLWPTNWTGYVLEQSPILPANPLQNTNWTTNSLPPYAVFGTNNGVTVPATNVQFYQLINP